MPQQGRVRPVGPAGEEVSHQATGIEREASLIVANPALLLEVIRRAVIVDPQAVAEAYRDGQRRLRLMREGGTLYHRAYGVWPAGYKARVGL